MNDSCDIHHPSDAHLHTKPRLLVKNHANWPDVKQPAHSTNQLLSQAVVLPGKKGRRHHHALSGSAAELLEQEADNTRGVYLTHWPSPLYLNTLQVHPSSNADKPEAVRAISHSKQGFRVFNILKEKNQVWPESRFTFQRSKCMHRESTSSPCQQVSATQLHVQQQSSDKVMRKEKWIKFGHKWASHILPNSQAAQWQCHSALDPNLLPQYKPVAQGTAAFPAEKLKRQKAATQETHQQWFPWEMPKKGEEKKN